MMKLSEAIRVGAKMRAASERGWNDVGPDGQVRSCALMAAAEGAGLFTIAGTAFMRGPNYLEPGDDNGITRYGTQPGGISSRMPDEWLSITMSREVPPCPCSEFYVADEVTILIWHLHDMHGWSREAVAEWIETIENKIETRAAQSEARRLQIAKDLDIEP